MNKSPDDLDFLPPHEATPVPGFHAYSRQLRVRPGEKLELCISHDGPVETKIHRLGARTREAVEVAALPRVATSRHTIARGSYVHIEDGLSPVDAFTVEVWCRPLADVPLSGLVSQSGLFTLAFEAGIVPCLTVGGTPVALYGAALALKEWHHLVGRWDGCQVALFVNGHKVSEADYDGEANRWGRPIRLGAAGNAVGKAGAFYTGDLWAPAGYDRPLSDAEIADRYGAKSHDVIAGAVGSWRFDTIEGEAYRDVSKAGRHGRPVNYPLRMIPGPRRTEECDWCTYDPTTDPDFGYAVRFMADQLLDCRWPVTTTWQVPPGMPPGQYVARLTIEGDEERDVYFLIVPPAPRARLLCLSTTSTRVAYNFQPFANPQLDYGAYQVHPSYPLLGHLIGSRRPNTGEPWERQTIDFELPFYAWLDREGIDYDLYSEWDLEEDPGLLESYDAVAWSGHSEYWTAQQYESLQAFCARGGHLLSLSGNTAYWRVSIDRANSAIEVRKHARIPTPGTSCDPMLNAAHWHQLDLIPGATMREAGFPEHRLLGNVSNGCTNPPLEGPRAGYEIVQPGHPFFSSPRAIATEGVFAPNAAGYETDLSSRSMLQRFGPIQTGQYPPRDGAAPPQLEANFDRGLKVLGRARIPDSNLIDYDNKWYSGEMWCEMLVWQRPGHGTIFSTGSVLSSEILLTDRNFSNFMLNVLDHLGIPTPSPNSDEE